VSVRIQRDGAVAVVVIDNPPVNATSHHVRLGLLDAVREINADSNVLGAVIMGAGRSFIAGADIREFDAPLADPQMPEVIAAVVDSPRTFVAALHGVALGGGFELALACDLRIASPGTLVGLPEVTLGMIPGAGGTQHLPRLVGIPRAIEIIASGRRLPVEEAHALGIVDRVIGGDLRAAAIEAASSAPKRRIRDLPAPEPVAREAIDAVLESASLPYDVALARERQVFQALRASDRARELRARFFATRPPKRPS
jgi:3-hydroxyacyl-CoA dehydrogenase